MVSDSLEPASTYENVHSKVIIDATKLVPADPRSGEPLEGSPIEECPAWRRGEEDAPGISESLLKEISELEDVEDCLLLRNSMLVVTVDIKEDPTLEQECNGQMRTMRRLRERRFPNCENQFGNWIPKMN